MIDTHIMTVDSDGSGCRVWTLKKLVKLIQVVCKIHHRFSEDPSVRENRCAPWKQECALWGERIRFPLIASVNNPCGAHNHLLHLPSHSSQALKKSRCFQFLGIQYFQPNLFPLKKRKWGFHSGVLLGLLR